MTVEKAHPWRVRIVVVAGLVGSFALTGVPAASATPPDGVYENKYACAAAGFILQTPYPGNPVYDTDCVRVKDRNEKNDKYDYKLETDTYGELLPFGPSQ